MGVDLDSVLTLERKVWQAMIDGDAEADAALLANDYLGVYETGYGDRTEHAAQLADGPTVADYRFEKARVTELADGGDWFGRAGRNWYRQARHQSSCDNGAIPHPALLVVPLPASMGNAG